MTQRQINGLWFIVGVALFVFGSYLAFGPGGAVAALGLGIMWDTHS